jgi:hypothetical protein
LVVIKSAIFMARNREQKQARRQMRLRGMEFSYSPFVLLAASLIRRRQAVVALSVQAKDVGIDGVGNCAHRGRRKRRSCNY